MTVKDYLYNKNVRRYSTFVITASGENYYLHDGKRFTEAELIEAFPVHSKIDDWNRPYKGENSDTSKQWMQ